MQRTCIYSVLLLLGVLSRTEAYDNTNPPLAVVAKHILMADRIIATNWAAAQFGEKGFGFPITGERVKGIVNAVSAATYVGFQEHPDWEWKWQLQFYTGTNFLDAVCVGGDTLLANAVYRDASGVLEQTCKDCANQQEVATVYKGEGKEFADAVKAEAKQWLHSPTHKIIGEDKQKVVRYVSAFYAAGAAQVFVTDIKVHPNGKNPAWENAKYLCVGTSEQPGSAAKSL